MGPHIEMYLGKLAKDPQEEGWGVWFIVLPETGEVVGDVGFKGKPDESNCVEIGYGVAVEKRGKGYAAEAVDGIVGWAFGTGVVDRVTAECVQDNVASIRVLEKTGMKRTGSDGEMLYWALEGEDRRMD